MVMHRRIGYAKKKRKEKKRIFLPLKIRTQMDVGRVEMRTWQFSTQFLPSKPEEKNEIKKNPSPAKR